MYERHKHICFELMYQKHILTIRKLENTKEVSKNRQHNNKNDKNKQQFQKNKKKPKKNPTKIEHQEPH